MTSATILAPATTAASISVAVPTTLPHSLPIPDRRGSLGYMGDLHDARDRINEDDAGKWDFRVLRRDLVMKNGEIEFPLDLGPECEDAYHERLAPTSYALGQMCNRLGLPTAYLRKCPLVLLDQNFNYWLKQGARLGNGSGERSGNYEAEHQPQNAPDGWSGSVPRLPAPARGGRTKLTSKPEEKWLLRARQGTLRAALSEHYSPLDNAALLDTLLPALPEHFRVQWLGLTDASFHLRVVDPSRSSAVLPGDDLFTGVHIANSEIGFRSLTVDALVYRVVCTNGLIALAEGKSLLRLRHIHVAQPRFQAALQEAVAQAIAATDGLLKQLQHAAKSHVADPEETIDRLARLWHQNEGTAEIAKAALLAETDVVQHTVYGVVNAFTQAAQSLADDKRYELEVWAGQLAQRDDAAFLLNTLEKASRNAGPEPGSAEYARQRFGAQIVAGGRS